jgi:putative ABC transport system permease protein
MRDWRPLVRQRLAALDLDPTSEADIIEELSAHLDDRMRELTAQGMTAEAAEATLLADGLADEALSSALASYRKRRRPAAPLGAGDPQRGGPFSGLVADARYAARALLKRPGLTTIALLTLAIGLGVNAAIFGFVNAVLLRPLPYANPHELVTFWGTAPDKGLPVVNYPDALYAYYRQRLRAVQPMAMYSGNDFTLSGKGDAERVDGAIPTVDFFKVLGATPLLGRTFREDDHANGRNNVAVISYRLWQRRFAGDSAIIGKSLTLDNQPTTIIGVMRSGFEFPRHTSVWVPLVIDPQSLNCWCYDAIGRMVTGATPESMARDVDAINGDFWAEREGRPRTPIRPGERSGTVVRPLATNLVGEVRQPLLLLLGAAGIVLLIACANLANLLLASTSDRQREIAVRCSLGASPKRIVRQLFMECVLLSVGGAVLGLGLAALLVRVGSPFVLERVPYIQHVGVEPAMLGFAAAIATVTCLLVGVVPALKGAGISVASALKQGLRTTGDKSTRRLNDGFVVAQIALSLMLLVGAGLLLRSLGNLLGIDPGFRAQNATVGRISLPWTTYGNAPAIRTFAARLESSMRALPGISVVGLTNTAPFSSNNNQQEMIVQGKEPNAGEPVPVASVRAVSDAYFDAVGTPLLMGRFFNETDRGDSALVAIIDQSTAARYWPNASPIGAKIAVGDKRNPTWRTIVGVVATIRHQQLDRAPDHYVYGPLSQVPVITLDIVARSPLASPEVISMMRRAVRDIDAGIPLYAAHTLGEAIDASLATRRMTNTLMLCFAFTALLLAALGIFGVIARHVAARVKEFGVRLALGATPAAVVALVVRRGATLVLVGIAIGVAGAIALAGFLRTLLFGVTSVDPATYALAPLLLATVALVACWLPARRATSADPLDALRAE